MRVIWSTDIPLWSLFLRAAIGVGFFTMLCIQMRRLPLGKKYFFLLWGVFEILLQLTLGGWPQAEWTIVALCWAQSASFCVLLAAGESEDFTQKQRSVFTKLILLAAGIGLTLARNQVSLFLSILVVPALIWFGFRKRHHRHRWAFRPLVLMSFCYGLIFFLSQLLTPENILRQILVGSFWCLALYAQFQVSNYFLLRKWIDQGLKAT